MGVHAYGKSRRGQEPFTAEEAATFVKDVMGADVGEVSEDTINHGMPTIEVDASLGEPPDADELAHAIAEMKESMSGSDEVSISMIKLGGDSLLVDIVKMIRGVWRQEPERWEVALNTAVGVLLHKKGDGSKAANYRCIWRIAIISRILAKILATRVRRLL